MVVNSLPPSGGGSGIFCKELSKRLVEKGHEVTVLTSKLSGDARNQTESEVFQIKRLKTLGLGWGISALCTPLPYLLKYSCDYDLVHLHGYLFLISNQAALAKKVKPFPLLLHLHGGMEIPSPAHVGKFKPFVKEYLYDPIVGKFTLDSTDVVLSASKKDIEISLLYIGFILFYSAFYLLGFTYERHVMPLVAITIFYLIWLGDKRAQYS